MFGNAKKKVGAASATGNIYHQYGNDPANVIYFDRGDMYLNKGEVLNRLNRGELISDLNEGEILPNSHVKKHHEYGSGMSWYYMMVM